MDIVKLPGLGVSGSEALSFSTCQRKWWEQFVANLEGVTQGEAITRGVAGHELLALFLQRLKDGESYEDSRHQMQIDIGFMRMKAAMDKNDVLNGIMTKLEILLFEYVDTQRKVIENWELLGVEIYAEAKLPGTDLVHLVGKLDVLVRAKASLFGMRKGVTSPIDHKFVYNMWSDRAFQMNAQLPQYEEMARQLPKDMFGRELVVGGSFINQLRHRSVKEDKIKFSLEGMKKPALYRHNVLENHTAISLQILAMKQMSSDESDALVTRSISKYNCENCSFLKMCSAKMSGADTRSITRHEYRSRTYGYDLNFEEEESYV